MASKQVVSNIINAERAKATETTFGKSGDPWRDAPALAAQRQMFNATSEFGDKSAAYVDRYGTREVSNMDFTKPERAPSAQPDNAKQKGASVGAYRPAISGVVQ